MTICVQDRACIFDCVLYDDTVSKNGDTVVASTRIVIDWFDNLENIYENIVLDDFVIMSNHIHGIIGFIGTPMSLTHNKATNISSIISTFKSITTKKIKALIAQSKIDGNVGVSATIDKYGTIWQKSYYDHIIRDEADLQRVREYITNNPLQWELDELNPRNKNSDN